MSFVDFVELNLLGFKIPLSYEIKTKKNKQK